MKNRSFFLAVCIVCVFLTGCNLSKKEPPKIDPTLITSENVSRIVGMQWILESMIVDGKPILLAKEKPFIKIGEDGSVTGHASVNRFFGKLEITPEGLVSWPAPFGSTKMAGPPERMKQEYAFLRALPKISWLGIDGIRLYAESTDGRTKLIFYVPV